jgi:hypothetical protein
MFKRMTEGPIAGPTDGAAIAGESQRVNALGTVS